MCPHCKPVTDCWLPLWTTPSGRGIADLSLRQLAAAIGTSHRMLIYHFGSREGLLVAVTRAVEERERETLLGPGPAAADARQRVEAHQRRRTSGRRSACSSSSTRCALRGRPGTEGFLEGIVESWVGPMADALVEAGRDRTAARADARLGVAVVRGLLLDLLATGERQEVDEAFDRFLPGVRSGSRPARHRRRADPAPAPADPDQHPVVAR